MCISSGILSNQEIDQVIRNSRLCTLATVDDDDSLNDEDQPLLFVCEYRVVRRHDDLQFILESATPGVSLPEFDETTPVACQFQLRCGNAIKFVTCYGETGGTGICNQQTFVVDVNCLIGREYCFS